MTKKTDKQQLLGILSQFDIRDVTSALEEVNEGLMPKSKEFTNLGEKCSHGQDSCVGKAEFADGLEAIYDENNLLSAHFLTEGAQVQKAIAMVTLKSSHIGLPAGQGWGSGSLVSNTLFMTNNHVIEDEAFCDKINMQFAYQDNYDSQPGINPEFFETNEDSFFHTNAALDYTIVRLKRKPYKFKKFPGPVRMREDAGPDESDAPTYADDEQIAELRLLNDVIARKAPISAFDPSRILQIFGYTPGSRYGRLNLRRNVTYPVGLRLNVIQHPRGRKKEVVVQQNTLTDVHTNVIHYFSDTDYGSSGSPVFNNTWDLMALHHARQPSENANEGIRIDKIVDDLRSEFQSSNPAILAELGIS